LAPGLICGRKLIYAVKRKQLTISNPWTRELNETRELTGGKWY
jgi:hypothetical protein